MRECYPQYRYINHIATRMRKSLTYEWRIATDKILQRNTVLRAVIKWKSKIHRSNAFMKPTEVLQKGKNWEFPKMSPSVKTVKSRGEKGIRTDFPSHGAIPMYVLCGARYQLDLSRYWIYYTRVFPKLFRWNSIFNSSVFGNKATPNIGSSQSHLGTFNQFYIFSYPQMGWTINTMKRKRAEIINFLFCTIACRLIFFSFYALKNSHYLMVWHSCLSEK